MLMQHSANTSSRRVTLATLSLLQSCLPVKKAGWSFPINKTPAS